MIANFGLHEVTDCLKPTTTQKIACFAGRISVAVVNVKGATVEVSWRDVNSKN